MIEKCQKKKLTAMMNRKIFFIITITLISTTALTSCKKEKWDEVDHEVIYTVTFDSNGGSAVQAQNVIIDGYITEPIPPMLAGYTFDSWYKDSDLTQKWVFYAETVTSDLILYAKWKVATGTTGNLNWQITGDGTLIISGTGKMPDYNTQFKYHFEHGGMNYYTTAPWGQSFFNAVVVENGITSIGNNAFYYCRGFSSVTIPNSVTSIGDGAFYYCKGLAEVTITNSVTSIGMGAFYYCIGLTEVTIPSSVAFIGGAAFYYCTGLTDINVDAANKAYSSENGALFDKEKTTIIQCPAGKKGAFTIPNSVTTVLNSAFVGCSALTSVTIPYLVTSIGAEAFRDCSGLTEIIIPNSVTTIRYSTFSGCSGLTSIIIPNLVTTLEVGAFSNCTGLISVTIGSSVTIIDEQVFYNCSSLMHFYVDVANSVFSSDNGVLFDKEKTALIQYPAGRTGAYTIPSSVTSISGGAFSACRGLTSVTIPSSVTSIGLSILRGGSFDYCTGLTEIINHATIPQFIERTAGHTDYLIGAFANVNKTDITLRVPAASVAAYKVAAGWKDFGKIVAIELPEAQIYRHALGSEKEKKRLLIIFCKIKNNVVSLRCTKVILCKSSNIHLLKIGKK